MDDTMDIVYFFQHSQASDMEIRYSLRSVAQHFKSVNKVWIFGDCPAFIAENRAIIENVPHQYVATALEWPYPMTNFFQMFFAASLIPDLSTEFLWFCDDFILIDDLTMESARTIRGLENLDEVTNRGHGLWQGSLWRTYELLKRFRFPCLNFETHTPTYYQRKWIFDAYREFKDFVTNDRWFGMLGPTAILNHAVARNRLPVVDIRKENSRAGFWGSSPNEEQVISQCEGKQFLNFDDDALGPGILRYLERKFPVHCQYERS